MWDQRYREKEYVYGKDPNQFLREVHIRLPTGGRALCLCAGEGRNAVFLAEQGFDVTAVDYSSVGLKKTKKLAEERLVSLETIHADWSHHHIESNKWDVIANFFCHFPPQLRNRIHQESVEGLRSGGAFVLEGFTPDQLQYNTGGPPRKDLLFTLDELKNDLSELTFKIQRELVRHVEEGKYHTGEAAVVQLLSTKP